MRSEIKKRLSVLLAFFMTLSMFSQPAFAAESGGAEAGAVADAATVAVTETAAGAAAETAETAPEAVAGADVTAEVPAESPAESTAQDTVYESTDADDEAVADDTVDEVDGKYITVSLNAGEGYFGNDAENPTANIKEITQWVSSNRALYIGNGPEWADVPLHDGGWTFVGWYMDESLQTPAPLIEGSFDRYAIDEDTTLYAKYEEAWVVSFNCGSGYYKLFGNPSLNKVVYKVKKGDPLNQTDKELQYYASDQFMKNDDEGLFLDGWYLNPEFTGQKYGVGGISSETFIGEYVPTGDVSFYAKWVHSYMVTLSGNGGKWGTSDNKVLEVVGKNGYAYLDDTMELPVRPGYYLDGWYDNPNSYGRAEHVVNPHADMTLYAGWYPAHTVKYLSGYDGKFSDGTKEKVYYVRQGYNLNTTDSIHHSYFIPSENLINEKGYPFGGWYDNPQFNGHRYDFTNPKDQSYKPSADTTFYAKWLGPIPYPTADPGNWSWVKAGDKIRLYSETIGSVIYYTTDGTDPEAVSENLYRSGITVDKSMVKNGKITIRTKAVKSGLPDSEIAGYFYYFEKEKKASEDPAVSEDAAYAARAGVLDSEGCLMDMVWVAGVPESTAYTGKFIAFPIRVYDKNRLLKAGTDYTLKYQYNKNVASVSASKAPSVTVTGKGQYKNKIIVKFGIDPADISGSDFSADDLTLAMANKALKPAPILKWKGKAVANKKNAAYTVEYVSGNGTKLDSITSPGDYKAILKGKGSYTGIRKVNIKVISSDKKLLSRVKVKGISRSYRYTLSTDGINPVPIVPGPSLTYAGKTLTKGQDYDVVYRDNKDVGTATVEITGMGDYVGTKKVTFKIAGNSLKKAKFDTAAKTYTGSAISANIPRFGGVAMREGIDYEVEYVNNIKAGTAKAVYTGCGAFAGSKVTKKFKIAAYPLNKGKTGIDDKVTITVDPMAVYSKGGPKSDIIVTYNGEELEKGIDYTVQYKYSKANKNYYAIVKGKGNFKGTVNPEAKGFDKTLGSHMRYKYVPKDIGDLVKSVTVSDKQFKEGKASAYYYVKPVIKDVDGKALKLNTDYCDLKYTYVDATVLEDGTVREYGEELEEEDVIASPRAYIKVTATGKGNYRGSVSATYRVFETPISKVTFTIMPKAYTGRSIEPDEKDILAVMGKGADATPVGDYEIVSYGVNIKGKGTVVVRGTGRFGGTKTITFTIVPKSV